MSAGMVAAPVVVGIEAVRNALVEAAHDPREEAFAPAFAFGRLDGRATGIGGRLVRLTAEKTGKEALTFALRRSRRRRFDTFGRG